jgi:RNA polymerase sigma-70 factor, ECF subfamily
MTVPAPTRRTDDIATPIGPLLPRLRRYALSLTRDRAAADDLVQETIARGLEKLHLWRPGTDLRAWLFSILHNLHVSVVRRAARERAMVKSKSPQAAASPAPPRQPGRLALRDLERGLAALPEGQRAVLLLVALDGERYETAASLLDIPLGTVRSRLSRGRLRLRELVEGEAGSAGNPIDLYHRGPPLFDGSLRRRTEFWRGGIR